MSHKEDLNSLKTFLEHLRENQRFSLDRTPGAEALEALLYSQKSMGHFCKRFNTSVTEIISYSVNILEHIRENQRFSLDRTPGAEALEALLYPQKSMVHFCKRFNTSVT